MDLIKKTKCFIKEKGLINKNDFILLAVSGGIDSIVLAHILIMLKDDFGCSLAIANFNHHLRTESDEEGEFVAKFATNYNIPFYLGGANIAEMARGNNLQEVARKERYAYLRTLAAQLRANSIALAHHADDQAETVLLHLLRGSGLNGLSAMTSRENDIIRPLLFAFRNEIFDYMNKKGLDYREDSSNADIKYLRNKIRHQLIPFLRDYNPNISETLNILSNICYSEDSLIEDLTENAFSELWINEDNALNKSGFNQLPIALKRRVIRKAYNLLVGHKKELNFKQVEAIIALKDEQSISLPGGMIAFQRGNIFFATAKPSLPQYLETYPLIADGLWHKIDDLGWECQVASKGFCIGSFEINVPARLLPSLRWRTRNEGDSVTSEGKYGKTKLKDIFIENHIPIYQRNCWPLLVFNEEIIWVCGLWHKTYDTSERLILIKVRIYDKIKN